MKKYIFAAILAAAGAMASCTEFLDVKPKGKDVPTTVAHYNGLFNNNDYLDMGTLYHFFMTDECQLGMMGTMFMSLPFQKAWRWEADLFDENTPADEFDTMYERIYTCNLIADQVMDAEEGTVQEKKALLAEARALRAWHYMMLAQYFGKPYNTATAAQDLCVPIVKEANSVAMDYKRSTVAEVWKFIIEELEAACPDLGEVSRHRLRIYQPAGYIFLGKAYWLTGRWSEAATAFSKAEAAIANASMPIELFDYNVKLAAWGYDSPLWAAGVGSYPYEFSADNTEVVFSKQNNSSLMLTALLNGYGLSTIMVKPSFMALYQAEDHRQKFFDGNPMFGYCRLGVRVTINEGADLPDYYLMYAEAAARSGNQSKARTLVTELREHRIDPAAAAIPSSVSSQDDLVKFIVEERTREFMMMGRRWFDMRRLWNDPLFQDMKAGYVHDDDDETTSHTLTEARLTLRIPPSVLKFNTGWEDNE